MCQEEEDLLILLWSEGPPLDAWFVTCLPPLLQPKPPLPGIPGLIQPLQDQERCEETVQQLS